VAQANDQYVTSLYRHNVAKLSLARALGAGENYKNYLGESTVADFTPTPQTSRTKRLRARSRNPAAEASSSPWLWSSRWLPRPLVALDL